jgi:hypothetical protein
LTIQHLKAGLFTTILPLNQGKKLTAKGLENGIQVGGIKKNSKSS